MKAAKQNELIEKYDEVFNFSISDIMYICGVAYTTADKYRLQIIDFITEKDGKAPNFPNKMVHKKAFLDWQGISEEDILKAIERKKATGGNQ